ncbi:hypothetical protein ACH5RR_034824 [Cinchona calisaya]|uniref:Uncharacterized protein n=1 Tax=Cinchona calisaya TaxID=153742 RepID=A0ABD2YD82_9GENT
MYDFENKINQSVFPGLQGGPHYYKCLSCCTATGHDTRIQVISRASFQELLKVCRGIDWSRIEKILESVHIAANKNTLPGMCQPWFLEAFAWEPRLSHLEDLLKRISSKLLSSFMLL